MKSMCAIMLLLSTLIYPVWAQEQKNSEEDVFLYEFLAGTYRLIGVFPDSDKTYSGTVELTYVEDELKVVRIIDDKKISGKGTIEPVVAGEARVLRIRFRDNKRDYEATYLIQPDLDNYGRLSGYLYLKEGGTQKPGLEALFMVRTR